MREKGVKRGDMVEDMVEQWEAGAALGAAT
jgi:hypothetical protein